MKSKLTFILALLCGCFTTQSLQAQDPHFSQFYAAPLHLNPALAGVYEGKFRVAMNYRDQWASILPGNSFQTVFASFDMRNYIGNNDYFTFGINVMHDEAGEANFHQNRAHLTLAYMKQMGGGRYRTADQYLVVGGQVGAGQNSINWDDLWFSRQYNHTAMRPDPGNINSGETGITNNNSTDIFLDFNAGLLYYILMGDNRSFYIGGALNHINKPDISLLEGGSEALYTRWHAHLGAEIPFSGELSILPAAVVMAQGPSLQTVGGANFRYSNDDWNELALRIGGWARVANSLENDLGVDAFIITAVLETGPWNAGISYDFTASSLAKVNQSRGGFELSLQYIHPEKSRFRVKCPNF